MPGAFEKEEEQSAQSQKIGLKKDLLTQGIKSFFSFFQLIFPILQYRVRAHFQKDIFVKYQTISKSD